MTQIYDRRTSGAAICAVAVRGPQTIRLYDAYTGGAGAALPDRAEIRVAEVPPLTFEARK